MRKLKIGYNKHRMLFMGQNLFGHEFVMISESKFDSISSLLCRDFKCKNCNLEYTSRKYIMGSKCFSFCGGVIKYLNHCEDLIMQRILE